MLATATRQNRTIRVQLPKLHPAQRAIKHNARRFNVLLCGRRFGKDILLSDLAIGTALAGQPAAWFAPTYSMLSHDWDMIEKLTSPVISRRNRQEKQLTLITGGVIDFWSLDSENSARGRKYARAVINEAAFVPRLMDSWNMVIRPTLADLRGDCWFSGTPKGMNEYYTIYQGALSDPANWQACHYTTFDNPYIPRDEIEAMKLSLPERAYLQEIMATFIEDGAGVLRFVRQAATATPQTEAIKGHEYCIGVDWARTDDATVFIVIDITLMQAVYIDRMNNTDYNTQRMRLRALFEKFKPRVIIAEYNSMGGPQVEILQRDGLPVQPFTTTNATKAQIIDALALAFEQGKIKIIDDPVLVGECQAYTSERLPSGLVRYSAPEGMHDDTVIALALAWASAQSGELIAWEW